MVTISHIVEKMVKENPSLEIALSKGLISYSKLARNLRMEVEKELGKKVKDSAIVVALKRLKDKSEYLYERKKVFYANELTTTSNLMATTIIRSKGHSYAMKRLHDIPELEIGVVLNVIHGNHQTTVIFSEVIGKKVYNILKNEKIISEETDLAQICISFDEKMYKTPGFIVYVLKELSWNNVNIVEIVSTYTELIIVVKEEDLMNAYKIIKKMLF